MPAHEGADAATPPLCGIVLQRAVPHLVATPVRATSGIGSLGTVKSAQARDELLPGNGPLQRSWKPPSHALKGCTHNWSAMEGCRSLIVGNASAQLAQYALTLSLDALRNPNPPFAKDVPALSIISFVLGMCPTAGESSSTRRYRVLSQRHRTTTGGQSATGSSPKQMRERGQEKPRALQQIAHCHDPAEVVCSSFVVRTSASTWSPCPNGVPNRFTAYSSTTTGHSSTRPPGEWLSSLLQRYARNQLGKHLRGSTTASSLG